MKAAALKEKLIRKIEQEEDLSILETMMSRVNRDIDPILKEKLTARALKAEKDIAEGNVMTLEQVRDRLAAHRK